MANDNAVEIRFSAATDDALAGIEEVRSALGAMTAPVGDVNAKLAALHEREPLVETNRNLRVMLEAGARADILRLKPRNPPRWMLDWLLS